MKSRIVTTRLLNYFYSAASLSSFCSNQTICPTADLESRIADAINIHEPRVAHLETRALWTEDRNQLDVSIRYVILGIPPKLDDISLAFKP